MRQKHSWITLTAVFALSLVSYGAGPGSYNDNASFLSYNFLHYPVYAGAETDEFLYKADVHYKVKFLLPNVGLIAADGTLEDEPSETVTFLSTVKDYEDANGVSFIALAYINGHKETVDLSDSAVRANIVEECKRFVSMNTPGSYTAGGVRNFGGVVIDIEPSGNDDAYYSNLKQLMYDIRNAFDAMGLSGKKTGITPHKLGTGSAWKWTASYYHYMGVSEILCKSRFADA